MNKQRTRRLRFRVEVALTTISTVALVLTLVARDWIERTIGASPDGGSGEIEWLLTGGALVATLVFALITTVDWRVTRPASAST